jgi:hypothetical protein
VEHPAMPDPVLTSPLAFELCENGKCAKAKTRDEMKGADTFKVGFCKQDDEKCGKGCYCQLFRRKKDDDKGTWDVVKLDENREDTDYDGDKYDYECFCVSPILETSHTLDGVDYTVRFVPCSSMGACAMTKTVTPQISGQTVEVTCEGKCDGDCKCTLFRLKVKKSKGDKAAGAKWSAKDAKWEYVAPGNKKATREDGYYYRCFCVK